VRVALPVAWNFDPERNYEFLLNQLAALPLDQYQAVRKSFAKQINSRPLMLDRAVAKKRILHPQLG